MGGRPGDKWKGNCLYLNIKTWSRGTEMRTRRKNWYQKIVKKRYVIVGCGDWEVLKEKEEQNMLPTFFILGAQRRAMELRKWGKIRVGYGVICHQKTMNLHFANNLCPYTVHHSKNWLGKSWALVVRSNYGNPEESWYRYTAKQEVVVSLADFWLHIEKRSSYFFPWTTRDIFLV